MPGDAQETHIREAVASFSCKNWKNDETKMPSLLCQELAMTDSPCGCKPSCYKNEANNHLFHEVLAIEEILPSPL